MRACLEDFEFECQVLTAAQATRADILAAYRQLIEASEPTDAAVIYFSGHGGLVTHSEHPPCHASKTQFLVPSDYEQDPEAPFLGITDWELSHYLALLTQKTQNATVILDCCHAGSMSRNAFTARNIHMQQRNLTRHLEQVAAELGTGNLPTETNPHAVRLAATRPETQAFEYPSTRFGQVGLFTEALVDVLKAVRGKEVTWERLFRQVREWVLGQEPRQRPCLEGPGQRVLFETRALACQQGPTFFYHQPHPTSPSHLPALRGGYLADIREGDIYDLAAPVPRTAKVRTAHADLALLELEGDGWIQPGTPALLRQRSQPRQPVQMDATATNFLPLLSNDLSLKAWQQGDSMPPVAHVSKIAGQFEVRDRDRELLIFPTPSPHQVLQVLQQCAKAQALLSLVQTMQEPNAAFRLEETWGLVQNGQPYPLPNGYCLQNGDCFFLELTNAGQEPMWVNIINIGVGKATSLLNQSTLTTGIHLLPGQSQCLGHSPYKGLVGLEVSWPKAVPAVGIRSEWVMVVASSVPMDLSMVQYHDETRSWMTSSLFNLVAQRSQVASNHANLPHIGITLRHFEMDPRG